MNIYTSVYKDYYIKPNKDTPSLYEIVTVGKGGKVPNCLTGSFTSKTWAMREIDIYLQKKQKDNNAKGSETGSEQVL